jgi:glycosyltransferase involved in cell wall biosynthesis
MSEPIASICIGVYNRRRQIVPCVESLLRSTFRDFEIVLVEDASSDGSGEVLEELSRRDPTRIRVLNNAKNRGASGSRNVAMDAARGKYLLFLDSDCIAEPGWIGAMVDAFERTGAAAISGAVLDKPPTNLTERSYVGSCFIMRKSPNLMESNFGLRSDVRMRLDETIFGGEGDDLTIRLRAAGHSVALVPDAVVHHHHALDFPAYMRMGRQQGHGHALYWFKHGIVLGRDVVAGSLAILTVPLALLDARLLAVPLVLAALQVAAILLNEAYYKRKPLREAIAVLPVSISFYAVRIVAVLSTWAGILAGREPAIVESRRRWRAERAGRPE